MGNKLGLAMVCVLLLAAGGCGGGEVETAALAEPTADPVKTETVRGDEGTPKVGWDIVLTKDWWVSPKYLGTPSWSPDSARLVIDAEGIYEPIVILNLDGSPPTSLFSEWCGSFGWPAWSPQGDEIAFVYNQPAYCEPTLDRDGLYIVDLRQGDNPEQVRLVREFPPGQRIYGLASWSPDGEEIFFGVYDEEHHSAIRRIRADGAGEEQVVSIAPNSYFRLSPDGRQLVFGKGGWDFQQLWVLDLVTGEERQLSKRSFWLDGGPTWSPNGDRIAFGVSVETRSGWLASETYVINADGSELRLVDEGGIGSVAWSPDGRWLAGVVSWFEVESGGWANLVLKEVDF